VQKLYRALLRASRATNLPANSRFRSLIAYRVAAGKAEKAEKSEKPPHPRKVIPQRFPFGLSYAKEPGALDLARSVPKYCPFSGLF